MRLLSHIAVGATVVALVAGCGSSSKSGDSSPAATASSSTHTTSTTAASAITKSAFVARANAICNASNAELGKAAQQAFGNQQPTATQWRPFAAAKLIPIVQARIEAIRALSAPQGDANKINAIVDAGLTAANTARQNPQVLSPSSPAPFDRFDQLVNIYGLPACTVGG